MRRKRWITKGLLLLAAVIFFGMTESALAAGRIAVNETNFPDEYFREYVEDEFADVEEDGKKYISAEKAVLTHRKTKSLLVFNAQITGSKSWT